MYCIVRGSLVGQIDCIECESIDQCPYALIKNNDRRVHEIQLVWKEDK